MLDTDDTKMNKIVFNDLNDFIIHEVKNIKNTEYLPKEVSRVLEDGSFQRRDTNNLHRSCCHSS